MLSEHCPLFILSPRNVQKRRGTPGKYGDRNCTPLGIIVFINDLTCLTQQVLVLFLNTLYCDVAKFSTVP